MKRPATQHNANAVEVLYTVGKKMRHLRRARGLTLQELAKKTGLSAAMLSMIERGKASPSVGSLVVISATLGLQIPELLGRPAQNEEMVTREAKQNVIKTAEGVVHRVITKDTARGLEITLNDYARGTSNSAAPITHQGFEYGLILDGALAVIVNGEEHRLKTGDLISYPSSEPHQIINRGRRRALALWINLHNG
jgi:transcriptional regulator with XRE-family HTH domain